MNNQRTGHVWSKWPLVGHCLKCGQNATDGPTWTVWCQMRGPMRRFLGKRKRDERLKTLPPYKLGAK